MTDASLIEGVQVSMATSLDTVMSNIGLCKVGGYKYIHDIEDWRELVPIAIVGGGPSLAGELDKLRKYKYVMACGSVHDFLCERGIWPNWTVVCDPDPIVNNYLKYAKHNAFEGKYLIASQCSPETFKYLNANKIYAWDAAGGGVEFPGRTIPIAGGCTVGTRAIIIAHNFGYENIHLFGFDTCVGEKHHAYDFSDESVENIGDIMEITLEGDDKKFNVAGYMLGQLFDFKEILSAYAHKIKFTIHGYGLLKHLMDISEKQRQEIYKNG